MGSDGVRSDEAVDQLSDGLATRRQCGGGSGRVAWTVLRGTATMGVRVVRRHVAYRLKQRRRAMPEEAGAERELDRLLAAGETVPPALWWRLVARQMGALAAFYQPGARLRGAALLLRSRSDDHAADLGWGPWASTLRIAPVGGAHNNQVREPFVRRVATALDRSIRAALGDTGGDAPVGQQGSR